MRYFNNKKNKIKKTEKKKEFKAAIHSVRNLPKYYAKWR